MVQKAHKPLRAWQCVRRPPPRKCNPSFGAKSAQTITGLPRCISPATAYNAINRNSRKFSPKPRPVKTPCTIASSISTKKTTCMESLKMQSLIRCKERTNRYGPANVSVTGPPLCIVPSVEIHANSRLNTGRYKTCANASGISTKSLGYGEF